MKAKEFDKVIEKFGFEVRNSNDKLAWLVYEGKKIVWTKRSHGSGDVPCRDLIRQQLRLNQNQLKLSIQCKLSKQDYIEILREKGHLA